MPKLNAKTSRRRRSKNKGRTETMKRNFDIEKVAAAIEADKTYDRLKNSVH